MRPLRGLLSQVAGYTHVSAQNMKHRLAAGVIVEHEERVLLVRHRKPGSYDFWVAPGGGAEGAEDLKNAARREVLEECGLHIEPLQLIYIEDLVNPNVRECKFWFTGKLIGGTMGTTTAEAAAKHIVEAAWLSRSEFEGKTVFPPMLREAYWQDRERGFVGAQYVGLRHMEFW